MRPYSLHSDEAASLGPIHSADLQVGGKSVGGNNKSGRSRDPGCRGGDRTAGQRNDHDPAFDQDSNIVAKFH